MRNTNVVTRKNAAGRPSAETLARQAAITKLENDVAPLSAFLKAMNIDITEVSSTEVAPVAKRTVLELTLEGDQVSDAAKRHVLRQTFERIAEQAGIEAVIERSVKNSNSVVAHIYLDA